MDSLEVLKARRILIQHAFDEICAETKIERFQSHTYCTLSKLFLTKTAQEEGLFTPQEDWFKPECRNELLKKVKSFLIKHIR
ncbi:MAG: hypothetical protein HWN79_00700 [Candidatus Lokiarchaeota archaeon]|nr:hypothetical protein [Candidatus Lokiarchaeota archaeon]